MTAPSDSATGRVVTFYSFKGGAGRTMALANVAWILAGNGKRVLTVDWDLEAPGLHSYFHPLLADPDLTESPGVLELIRDFPRAAQLTLAGANGAAEGAGESAMDERWYREQARVDRYAVGLDLRFPSGGRLDLLPAGVQNPETYTRTVATFDWHSFWESGGDAFLQALREDMTAHYDYVLIDSRTGLTDTAGICTILLPDLVVDCFTLSRQAVNGAVLVAETIHEYNRLRQTPIRILPVPMRVEDAGQDRLDAGRDTAHARFGRYLDWVPAAEVERYWGDVEIPYKPAYAYEEIPATVGDPAAQEGTLLAAFERLTEWITGGEVRGFPGMDEGERRALVGRYERAKAAFPADLCVSYAPEDRMWADWAAGVLGAAGYRVTLSRASGPPPALDAYGAADLLPETVQARGGTARVLVLLSRHYARLDRGRVLWRQLAEQDARGGMPALIPVRVDESPLPEWVVGRSAVELARATAEEASAELRAVVGTRGDAAPVGPPDLGAERLGVRRRSGMPRLPGSTPAVWRVPPRNAAFTGRAEFLEQLRDSLVTPGAAGVLPQALHGLGGVGKSQIALEYAHRFAADYDLVCWLSAEDPARIRQELATLAPQLGIPVGEDVSATAVAVLEALRLGRPYSRWLLIFDNAEHAEQLQSMLPAGSGHIVITSRNPAWARVARSVEVELFSRDESIALMHRYNPGLAVPEADEIAQELGDLPLAVGQAAAWLEETRTDAHVYLEQLRTQLARILESGRGRHSESAAATWLLSTSQLRERHPAAAVLLETCAFFGSDPIPLYVLGSRPMRELLSRYDPGLGDEMLMSRLYGELNRYGLARIDMAAKTLSVHRLIQAVLREEVPQPEREAKRELVRSMLAAADPNDADNPALWERYAALHRHLWPTEAERSHQPDVRLWICHLVRYLWLRGDYASCWEIAERVLAVWVPDFGDADPMVLYLRVQYANALRSGGRIEDAFRTDTGILERAAASPEVGEDHPYALAAAMGMGADLRAQGRYRDAVERDTDTLRRTERVFGDSAERTLMCAANLGISLWLAGRPVEARELDEQTWRRNREVHGPDHMRTLNSAVGLAGDLRTTGELTRALRLMEDTYARWQRVFGATHPRTVHTALELALTLRACGRIDQAMEVSARALDEAERVFGPRHRTTLALQVTLAANKAAAGEPGQARELTELALAASRSRFGDRHPFSLACASHLAVLHRLNGDHEVALRLSEETLRAYEELLGERHPFTAACRINHATDLAEDGETARAVEQGREAYQALRERIGPDHVQTLVAAANLALDLRRSARDAEARLLHEEAERRARATLGAGHPVTRAIADWRRADVEIDPPTAV